MMPNNFMSHVSGLYQYAHDANEIVVWQGTSGSEQRRSRKAKQKYLEQVDESRLNTIVTTFDSRQCHNIMIIFICRNIVFLYTPNIII